MLAFNKSFSDKKMIEGKEVFFFDDLGDNIDHKTVEAFGEEWTAFSNFSENEIKKAGDQYFDIIQNDWIEGKYILDVGCGTGRWSKYVASKAHFVEAIDPSKAVFSAALLLNTHNNIRISKASVDTIPFDDHSFDFVFSLGVLHHIPNTSFALKKCVEKLKKNGYFLVYLYYDFEQRGIVFKSIFYLSSFIRIIVSNMPTKIKKIICNLLAFLIYLPLINLSKLIERIGFKKLSNQLPLSYYKAHSLNIIFNDALDRFGTPLEQRFSKSDIKKMMEDAGLTDILFSDNEPYWHAVGRKV